MQGWHRRAQGPFHQATPIRLLSLLAQVSVMIVVKLGSCSLADGVPSLNCACPPFLVPNRYVLSLRSTAHSLLTSYPYERQRDEA
jgi:hypothetical protein